MRLKQSLNKMRADIKLGYSCNDDCIHCVVSRLRKEAIKKNKLDLNFEEYKKEIDNLKKENFTEITVTGGEPTIRNDFIKIIEYIKKNNFKIDLQTNGRRLSDFNFLKKYTPK